MIALLRFILAFLAAPFKSKSRLEAENAALRHQLIVLRRKVRGQVRLTNSDRWFLVQLYRWFPSILQVLTIVQPETLVRWHRAGFRCYWRWKSRLRGGRPQIAAAYGQKIKTAAKMTVVQASTMEQLSAPFPTAPVGSENSIHLFRDRRRIRT